MAWNISHENQNNIGNTSCLFLVICKLHKWIFNNQVFNNVIITPSWMNCPPSVTDLILSSYTIDILWWNIGWFTSIEKFDSWFERHYQHLLFSENLQNIFWNSVNIFVTPAPFSKTYQMILKDMIIAFLVGNQLSWPKVHYP